MLTLEWEANASLEYEDCLADSTEKRCFGSLIFQGASVEQAREQAASAAGESVRNYRRAHSPGRRERERRRAFREAVTASDGALAVTTGLVQTCIVCGSPFRHWRPRSDSAYCSNACRQAAYRKRRNGQGQQKPISAIQFARERHKIDRVLAGIPLSTINEFRRVANLSEEEFEKLLEYQPKDSVARALRAMQAAKRRPATEGSTKRP
jgi:hypothetical protein